VLNLLDGFDCYNINDGRHLANLATPIIQNVPLPSLFIDGGQSILCGSSCGYVLIYSRKMNNVLQVLRHAGTCLEINAAATINVPPRARRHSNIGSFLVILWSELTLIRWRRPIVKMRQGSSQRPHPKLIWIITFGSGGQAQVRDIFS
jgi:hypothetical protein